MFARYYGSGLFRFLSRDPVGGTAADPQTYNAYTYVRNSPNNMIDPTGMYGISPNPYNPGGTNPCDGMGPNCSGGTGGSGDSEEDKEGESQSGVEVPEGPLVACTN